MTWRGGRDLVLALNERARRGYDECPDACAQEPAISCSGCKRRYHRKCRGTAAIEGLRVECVCAREGHVL